MGSLAREIAILDPITEPALDKLPPFDVPDHQVREQLRRYPGTGSAVLVPWRDGFSVSVHDIRGARELGTDDGSCVWIALEPLRIGDESLKRHDVLLAPGIHMATAQTTARVLEIQYVRGGFRGRCNLGELTALRDRRRLSWIPRALLNILSPRDLYLVVGPERKYRPPYGIHGPQHLVVTAASAPIGTGPALHIHTVTWECFVVLEGRFRVRWGDTGEHSAVLGPLDSIAIPRGVNRTFEAVEVGLILPIVVGANDELDDIVWLRPVREQLQAAVPGWVLTLAERHGLRFVNR